MEIKNGKVRSTSLGILSHGTFQFYVHIDYGGSVQGFGGYGLDRYDEEEKKMVGTVFGCEAIRQVLRVVGVEQWEELPGKPVRVKRNDGGGIVALGNYLKDEWLNLNELFNECKNV